ncbi:MAG: Na+/H+ antiporter NhaC family protein [Erysipelotrichales bacterium]|nr:Na+/H+ antiporter NhaC family protein [Erysipelotrichales bacterium]
MAREVTEEEEVTLDDEDEIETEEEEEEIPDTPFYSTFWALLPPLIAIALALITKEVYSSLFVGILAGAALYANFNFEGTLSQMFVTGFIGALSDPWNVGILLFLVLLGSIVALLNKAGGSAAFGEWASKHIKSRLGAQLATICLGVLIFVDDYFNCLTVGSVMRPVTDKFKVSRAKLAYLIDATAAPICIIAPISSWAAAVAAFAQGSGMNGIELFIRAIPYNMYAILTIVALLALTIGKFDFGPMKKFEVNAEKGDIFTTGKIKASDEFDESVSDKGKVWDLVLPVLVLIISCIIGMIYSGGFFTAGSDGYHNFIDAFAGSDASVGLVYGSFGGIIFAIIYMLLRRLLNFKQALDCIPEGFKAMVPAIMILTCAWTLKIVTDGLGADVYIASLVRGSASTFMNFLPAIIFLIAIGLAFATGTSWGTFGILIPIVIATFNGFGSELTIIAISACMAGAVCGDHCSPISDTTIMASAGAQCNHIDHVSTQLPYALVVAAVSFITYIAAGFIQNAVISLVIGIVLMLATLFLIKKFTKKSA